MRILVIFTSFLFFFSVFPIIEDTDTETETEEQIEEIECELFSKARDYTSEINLIKAESDKLIQKISDKQTENLKKIHGKKRKKTAKKNFEAKLAQIKANIASITDKISTITSSQAQNFAKKAENCDYCSCFCNYCSCLKKKKN